MYQLISTLFFSFVCASELSFISFNDSSNHTLAWNISCDIVGFFLTIAVNSKFFVTFWLTFHLFAFAVFSKDLRRLEPLYILTSFGIPLLFAWIPFVNNLYGIAGAWCWIKNWDCNKKLPLGFTEQYLFLYIPGLLLLFLDLLMIIITVSVLMYQSYCSSSKAQEECDPLLQRQVEKQKKAFKEILPLILYPIIFIILFLPSAIHRIYGVIEPGDTRFFLFVLHASTGSSWGLFVGIAIAIHICVLKCCRIPLQLNTQNEPSGANNNQTNNDPVYTTETIASTNARTYYAPRESEVSLLFADTGPQ
uniref:G-protein coupled receptors family 2 profile 2 domain-containing protein n=1 Tax=Amphimedon queenslandica TaxID=400682 RepID=A0A1X7TA22_AMPQE